MIQALLTYLDENLLSPGTTKPVTVGQSPNEATGSIGLLPGALVVSREVSDLSASAPRPERWKETVASPNHSAYKLEKTVLQGSILGYLVFNPDANKKLLTEGAHFTMDYPKNTLTLSANLDLSKDKVKELILEYSYVGVFIVREFEQAFAIEVLADNYSKASELASLCATMVLTNHDAALEYFKGEAKYSIGSYASEHSLSQIQWLGGEALEDNGNYRYRLDFLAKGHIKAIKGPIDPDTFGILEEIRSPGATLAPGQNIKIEPELGSNL